MAAVIQASGMQYRFVITPPPGFRTNFPQKVILATSETAHDAKLLHGRKHIWIVIQLCIHGTDADSEREFKVFDTEGDDPDTSAFVTGYPLSAPDLTRTPDEIGAYCLKQWKP